MGPQQQGGYLSTDPNAGSPIPAPSHETPTRRPATTGGGITGPQILSGLGEIGKGGAKALGRTLVDLAALHMGPNAYGLSGMIPGLQSEGGREVVGGIGADLATGALLGAPARSAVGPARNIATKIQQSATGMTEGGARRSLQLGANLPTQGNAARLAQAAVDDYSGRMVQQRGRWVRHPDAPETELEAAARQLQAAADKPTEGISAAEVAGLMGGMSGSPVIGVPAAIAGGLKFASRPLPSAAAARLLYSGAPAIQSGAATASSPVAQFLMDALMKRSTPR